ncbi:racemase/epimerase [Aureococcus anophagefferens]|nr:racemase/epimerase [Aureococcus anophagefferens]
MMDETQPLVAAPKRRRWLAWGGGCAALGVVAVAGSSGQNAATPALAKTDGNDASAASPDASAASPKMCRAYAARHGYDVVVRLGSSLEDMSRGCGDYATVSGRDGLDYTMAVTKYCALKAAQDEGCDYALWTDADAVFVDTATPLEAFLERAGGAPLVFSLPTYAGDVCADAVPADHSCPADPEVLAHDAAFMATAAAGYNCAPLALDAVPDDWEVSDQCAVTYALHADAFDAARDAACFGASRWSADADADRGACKDASADVPADLQQVNSNLGAACPFVVNCIRGSDPDADKFAFLDDLFDVYGLEKAAIDKAAPDAAKFDAAKLAASNFVASGGAAAAAAVPSVYLAGDGWSTDSDESLADTRVLVTGAAGFIGSHVVEALVDPAAFGAAWPGTRPEDVVAIDDFNMYYSAALKRARAANVLAATGVEVQAVDVCDRGALDRLFEARAFTHVVHLAGQPGVRFRDTSPGSYAANNVDCFVALFEAAAAAPLKPYVVYASSSSVYGSNAKVPFAETDAVEQPSSLYGATKKADELVAYAYHTSAGLRSTGLRFFTVYGPWGRPDMSAYIFARSIDVGEALTIYNGGAMARDFTYVDDTVRGVLAALKYRAPPNLDARYVDDACHGEPLPDVFNLGREDPVWLRDYVAAIEASLGKAAMIVDGGASPSDVPVTYADASKAKALLGWEAAVGIEDGLARFVAWYAAEGRAHDGVYTAGAWHGSA